MNIVGKISSLKTIKNKTMGYISKFRLEIINFNVLTEKEKEQLKEDFFNIVEIEDHYIEELFKYEQEIEFEGKWYSREQNLKLLSRLHPKIKIEVDVEGEDREDYSRLFVFDGKTQTVKAVVSIMYEEDNKLWKD